MSGRVTTHVLDTASGKPAAKMRIELHRLDGGKKTPLADLFTDENGRAGPLVEGLAFSSGTYHLLFHVADYFAAAGSPDAGRFLGVVPVLFEVDDPAGHYHVPLLVSPWAYSTYRGS